MAESFAAEIFEVDEFTIDVAVPSEWNAAETIKGILDAPYNDIDLGYAGQGSTEMTIRFLTADIDAAAEDDTITIAGTGYRVGKIMPDGQGVTTMTLYYYAT